MTRRIKTNQRQIDQAPKTIKIYANRQVLGFDDTDSVKETQTIELTPENFEENAVVNLRFVKYQNITHIMVCIFFLFLNCNQFNSLFIAVYC